MSQTNDYAAKNEVGIVSAPMLEMWKPMPACAKCGLSVGFNIPIVRQILYLFHARVQNYAYCKGDHNSTIEVNSMFGKKEFPVECFGIFHEHIHLACNRCGYRWLMECRPKSKPDSLRRDFGQFLKWFFIVLGVGMFVLLLIANLMPH